MSNLIPADWPKNLLTMINRKDHVSAEQLIASMRARDNFFQHARLLSLEAWLFLDQGRIDQAIHAISEARKLEPLSIAYAHRHGEILITANKWVEAESAYSEAIALSLHANDTYFLDDSRARLAFCLIKQAKTKEAQQVLNSVSDNFESEIDGRIYRKYDLFSKSE